MCYPAKSAAWITILGPTVVELGLSGPTLLIGKIHRKSVPIPLTSRSDEQRREQPPATTLSMALAFIGRFFVGNLPLHSLGLVCCPTSQTHQRKHPGAGNDSA